MTYARRSFLYKKRPLRNQFTENTHQYIKNNLKTHCFLRGQLHYIAIPIILQVFALKNINIYNDYMNRNNTYQENITNISNTEERRKQLFYFLSFFNAGEIAYV